MTANIDMNDSPVSRPDADAYGFDTFAASLARGIARMSAPEGFVIALDGPWGSGKSSVVNLLLHHLRTDVPVKNLDVQTFSPWWYAGSDAIARGFFDTLGDVISGSLRGKAKRQAGKALMGLWGRFGPAKPFIGPAGNVAAGGMPAGTVALAVAEAAVEAAGTKRSLSEEYGRLSEALRDHGRRVLVVIDDIDRLDPAEATLVFQLVKSVGRLPNVLYLLAFDSEMARRQLEGRFGSAAADYLEKVVQVTYSIPVPGQSQLLEALAKAAGPLFGDVGPAEAVTRLWNLVHDCAAPWLRTPRDVVRLVNALMVGWPAIAGEANAADFLALEALKLSHPEVHRAVQRNPSLLCGTGPQDLGRHQMREERASEYDGIFLAGAPEKDRPALRTALRRLFPGLDAIYANASWHHDFLVRWRRDRLVCSLTHFSTYFQLSPSPQVLASVEVRALMETLDDPPRLAAMLRAAVMVRTETSIGTRAGLMLKELRDRVEAIRSDQVEPLLSALFEVADDIDVRSDDLGVRGWGNQLHISWLVRNLLSRQGDQEARSQTLLALASKAQVGFLTNLADECWEQHHPRPNGETVSPEMRLVTIDAATQLRELSLATVREAARTSELVSHPSLVRLLFHWARVAADEGQSVRQWTGVRLDDDSSVIRFAEAFTLQGHRMSVGDSSSLGDRVPTETYHVDRKALATICDVRRLDERATALLEGDLAPSDAEVLRRYLDAPPSWSRSPDDD